jgi:hypothetical protein
MATTVSFPGVKSAEQFKDVFPVFCGDANPVVAHVQRWDITILNLSNLSPPPRVLLLCHRVRDKIHKHLSQQYRIAMQLRELRINTQIKALLLE